MFKFIYQTFIDTCLKYYGLDPCDHFSAPAMLNMTRVKLEKIHDINVHLFMEKGMRGGTSYIAKSYSIINEKKSIMYWDANDLYGRKLVRKLKSQ